MQSSDVETTAVLNWMILLQDLVAAERDYLKQELGMFIEQMERLEKEKAAVLQELEEKREMDEFKSLEEGCRKENEVTRRTFSDPLTTKFHRAVYQICFQLTMFTLLLETCRKS